MVGEEGNMSAPELFTILFSLSLFLCSVGVLTGSPLPPICAPSSCGNLRDIRYPFRLAGDPQYCGRPEYELACEHNRTVLNFLSGKYYVLNITYESGLIRVVDVRLASSSCSLAFRSLLPISDYIDGPYRVSHPSCAAFVNCSRKINNTMYKPIPCTSSSSTHVYLVLDGYSECWLRSLQPSCHAISFVSLDPAINYQNLVLDKGEDVAVALQMGFTMSWDETSDDRASKFEQVGACWRYAFRVFFQYIRDGEIWGSPFALEINFYRCLQWRYYWGTVSDKIGPNVDDGYVVLLTTLLTALHLMIVLVLVQRLVVAPLSIFALLIRKFQEEHASIDTVEKFLQNQKSLMPARFTYPEILRITNHFEKRLGQGGFGSVFQGKLPGDYLVAVKMLSDSKCDGEDFINEVSTIGRIHHINITQLIGFCSEGAKRALIYEYMPNGSLDRYIFPSKGANSSLNWEKLHDIALGIARGIEYLHRGCDMCILHFDIKPHNILLDHNFTPKVSDFGLARLYPKDYSLVSVSAARGTIGYIAPELISRNFGAISYKSDVYSFGMLLLDMAGARKNTNAVVGKSSEAYFPAWIYDRLCDKRALEQEIVVEIGEVEAPVQGTVEEIGVVEASEQEIVVEIGDVEAPEQEIVVEIGEVEKKLCIVGLWCIQMKPTDRPSMSKVIEMLEGSTNSLQMPPKPFFSSPCSISAITSCLDTSAEGLSVILEV